MSDDVTDISNQPGLILRTARDELNYSLQRVADELHLRVSVVQAMENEDYSEFSSDVFLKGYFRSYCRLVNLHEERMVELLDKQLACRALEAEEREAQLKKLAQTKVRKKLAITVLLVLVLGACAGYLYTLYSAQAVSDLPNEQSVSSQVLTSLNQEGLPPAVDLDELEETTNKNAVSKAPDQSAASIQAKSAVSIEPPQTLATESADAASDSSINHMLKETADEKPVTEQVLKNENQDVEDLTVSAEVKILFSGDCWFKFTNGDGKTVFAALKKAGQEVKYIGKPPFKMVFGDARQATLSFNGQAVDLTPYTKKTNRAQVVLGDNLN